MQNKNKEFIRGRGKVIRYTEVPKNILSLLGEEAKKVAPGLIQFWREITNEEFLSQNGPTNFGLRPISVIDGARRYEIIHGSTSRKGEYFYTIFARDYNIEWLEQKLV